MKNATKEIIKWIRVHTIYYFEIYDVVVETEPKIRMDKCGVTSPGGNTPQGTNYTATYLPSRKLSKSDEPDMQDTAREPGTST